MTPPAALYLDTSVALRATLPVPLTSLLSLVESARALFRVRLEGAASDTRLADIRRDIDTLWNRCELWELSPAVCDLAPRLAPNKLLRTLDALHLATFLMARARIEGLELLIADQWLEDAANTAT